MKKIAIILFISGIITSCNTKEKISDFNIVGKWKAEDNSGSGYFIFTKSGFASYNFGNKKMDSVFTRNNKNYNFTYNIDYNMNPINLDLLLQNTETKTGMKMLGMIKLINRNEILYVRGGGNKERPTNFNQKETIRLKRVE
ncbi:hypothetical protein JBL43_19915 [Aureibaculum sp. A20]|uniref:Lipocalin-like domain-containing protein n=1 Tax=Aureibaculum flavum TaxID=2795986 RepID=A0ABS0WX24_9FLAO|nr:hypothetical protein [Aureibaculum flavum]MBJ2176525.1 hypothetical protein [Aureibaculum flavum]